MLSAALLMASCGGSKLSNPEIKPDTGGGQESGGNDGGTTGAAIKISASGNAKQLMANALGINTQTRGGPSWSDQRFLDQITSLHAKNLRYPGGNIGNFWNWSAPITSDVTKWKGLIQQNMRDPAHPTAIPTGAQNVAQNIYQYKLEDLKRGLSYSPGSIPIFMLNQLTDNVQDQIEMLKAARDLGMPVEYAELGNEFYLTYGAGGDFKTGTLGYYYAVFPTPLSYANDCRTWITEIRKVFPDIKIAWNAANYDGANAGWMAHTRTVTWNKTLMDANLDTDAAIIHLYSNSMNCTLPAQSFYNTKTLLDQNVDFMNSDLTGKKIWFTEYNIKADNNRYVGAWIMALHTVFYTAEILLVPQVVFACHHNISSETEIALIYRDATPIPVKYGSAETVTVTPLEMSASGYGFRMLGEALDDATSIQRLSFDGSPTLSFTLSGTNVTMPLLWGYGIQGVKYKRLILSLSSQPQTIACGNGVTEVSSISAKTLDEVIAKQDQITYSNPTPDGNGNVTVPPYSISIVSY